MCLCFVVRPLEVITNILIRSMGPVSEEDMVSNFFEFTVHIFVLDGPSFCEYALHAPAYIAQCFRLFSYTF